MKVNFCLDVCECVFMRQIETNRGRLADSHAERRRERQKDRQTITKFVSYLQNVYFKIKF